MTETFDEFNEFERSMREQRGGAYANSFEALTALTVADLLDAAGVHAGTDMLDVGTGPGTSATRTAPSRRRFGCCGAGADLALHRSAARRSS